MNTILNDKIKIIEHATLEDAEILDDTYSKLIISTFDDTEKQEYIILQTITQKRIKEIVH